VGATKLAKSRAIAPGFRAGEVNEIYSGEIISLNNSNQWVKGQFVNAGGTAVVGKTCYVALANAADTDVVGSGLLPALSCADNYEIESAWFDSAGTYVEDETLLEVTPTPANAATVAYPNLGKVYAFGSIATPAPGQDEEAAVVIGKVTKAPYDLNKVTAGVASYPRLSNEDGVSTVLAFQTIQN
jgi:hypothetical protein